MNTEPRVIDPTQCPRCGGHNTEYLGCDGTPTESWLCHDCEAKCHPNGDDGCYDVIHSTQISSMSWDTSEGPCEVYDEDWLVKQAAKDLLQALEGLFEHCVMVHKHWGDNSNASEADAAIEAARAAIAKVNIIRTRAKGEQHEH